MSATVRLQMPEDVLQSVRKAAEKDHKTEHDWMIETLRSAAHQVVVRKPTKPPEDKAAKKEEDKSK